VIEGLSLPEAMTDNTSFPILVGLPQTLRSIMGMQVEAFLKHARDETRVAEDRSFSHRGCNQQTIESLPLPSTSRGSVPKPTRSTFGKKNAQLARSHQYVIFSRLMIADKS